MFGSLGFLLLAVALYAVFGRKKGSKSYLTRVEADLQSCVAAGVLAPDQKEKVLGHIRTLWKPSSLRAVHWIAIFGGLFVATGLSLIVAHNWENLGAVVRIVGFLAIFAAVGEATVRLRGRNPAVDLALALLWFFLPVLGIGLYAQTFQLSGDPIRPFLVWAILVLPLVWVLHTVPTGVLFLVLAWGTLIYGNCSRGNLLSLISSEFQVLPWLLSLILIGGSALVSLYRLPKGAVRHVLAMAAVWIFILQCAKTPLYLDVGRFLLISGIALSTALLAAQLHFRSHPGEQLFGMAGWSSGLYTLTFLWHAQTPDRPTPTPAGLVVLVALVGLALILVVLLRKDALSDRPQWSRIGQALLATPLLLALALWGNHLPTVQTVGLISNFVFLGVALALVWHGAVSGISRQINTGVLMLTLLLVTRFVDVLGSFLKSGLGFILTGIFLTALAWGLHRGRGELLKRAKEKGGTP